MFIKAQPIWISDKESEMNCFASFSTNIDSLIGAKLHITAAFFYRVFVNNKFAAFGPARTAFGYAREDIIDLSKYNDKRGINKIVIEVAGYGCRSLSTCLTQSFLCAEIRHGDEVLAYSGKDLVGRIMNEKVRKVERYSVQRHFGEVWDYSQKIEGSAEVVILQTMPTVIDRVVPYPLYEDIYTDTASLLGKFTYDETLPCKETKLSFKPDEYWGYFPNEEICHKPFRWIQKQAQFPQEKNIKLPVKICAGEYLLFDLGHINCGFLQATIKTHKKCDLIIGFTEYCDGETFKFTNINSQNVIEYIMDADQSYEHISFEPYSFRYAILMLKEGDLTLSSFGVKTYERDMTNAFKPQFNDPLLCGIRDAAVRTFAHNALDIFTDCPSRERAGWLCDSYFTAKAEYFFFGDTAVEDAFLQNYYLYPKNAEIPKGVLPMCYPSDSRHPTDRGYIPQWDMWYVLEVEEYINDRNHADKKELFRESIIEFLNFLEKYENNDGLLERLPGWNFIEWSDANKWTEDINYPTNFLYSGVLLAAYKLYGNEEWKTKSIKIAKLTAERSFDGEMFIDNAVFENGTLKNTLNTSEACQYYAILFGMIDLNDKKYSKLREYVTGGFPDTSDTGRSFVPVNAFIGLYLRLKALLKLGHYKLLLDEVGDFFGRMVEKTGTLWEYRQIKGSLDHGFASFALPAVYEAYKKLNEE